MPNETVPTNSLQAEWQRIGLLAHGLAEARKGHKISQEVLERLKGLQQEVERGRTEGGAWAQLTPTPLSFLECDILAGVCAPRAEPYIGWLYQSLQAGTAPHYPSSALLQELLGLDSLQAPPLYAALVENAPLRRFRLIEMEGGDPYHPIYPTPRLTAHLLGRPFDEPTLPGATRVHKQPGWDDLVLPENCLTMLREFLLWIRHRETVAEKWGAKEWGGPVALFSGPSGTGKTFSAAVLANALGWPLFRIDLGRIVSKYIGETEKNLNRLFDAADNNPMVLQFDEADSLFSKRGEVKEARDRYANMEVSHLLARIESHRGPCILTTNLRGNLDNAFIRRFQTVVEFPRPDAQARAKLWQRLLPPRAPRDVQLDTAFVGRAVNLTGGGIRNAALHAAFLAAELDKPIGLPEVALAIWRELNKDGRSRQLSELGPLAPFFPKDGILC